MVLLSPQKSMSFSFISPIKKNQNILENIEICEVYLRVSDRGGSSTHDHPSLVVNHAPNCCRPNVQRHHIFFTGITLPHIFWLHFNAIHTVILDSLWMYFHEHIDIESWNVLYDLPTFCQPGCMWLCPLTMLSPQKYTASWYLPHQVLTHWVYSVRWKSEKWKSEC